jgi:DNA-binding CsgD family transcriptional regulator
LLRARGRPDFTPADTALVASVAGHLAQGLRRAHLLAEGLSSEGLPDRAVGLVMLAADDTMTAADKGGKRALVELRETSRPGPLPLAVAAVAGRARAIAAGHADGIARSRVRTRSGSWLVLHACTLGCDPRAETAVIIEPARGRELAPLIADAHGLTARERAVTQLVAEGLATEAIGERLHLSPWTVQDHLKAIFEKVGVGTRGELVARLFFDHDPPRLAGVTRPERVRRRA